MDIFLRIFLLFLSTLVLAQVQPVVDEPVFYGCNDPLFSQKQKRDCSEAKFQEFILKKLAAAKNLKNNAIEGLFVIEIEIDELGRTTKAVLLKGLEPQVDQEILSILREIPYWTPAESKGKEVKVNRIFPIRVVHEKDQNAQFYKILWSGLEAEIVDIATLQKHIYRTIPFVRNAKGSQEKIEKLYIELKGKKKRKLILFKSEEQWREDIKMQLKKIKKLQSVLLKIEFSEGFKKIALQKNIYIDKD